MSENTKICDVCLLDDVRYTCPSCSIKTCGISCSKAHKISLNCSGLVNHTKFINKKEFSNESVISDSFFLNEVSRIKSNLSRTNQEKQPFNKKTKLISQCMKRQIKLRIMPFGYRNEKNKSYHNSRYKKLIKRTDMIHWTIELKHDGNNKIINNIQETTLLDDILTEYDPSEYVYMKREGVPCNNPQYYELDRKLTIKDILKMKIIIEFPTFIICKTHPSGLLLNDGHDCAVWI